VAGATPKSGPRTAARRRAVELLYQADLLGRDPATVLAAERGADGGLLDPYTVELVEGVERSRPELDERIGAASRDWTVDRMPLIDRNVLRLGVFELTERPDVPTAVAIDEAIELVKLLSTDDSGRFVNGVLATIARQVRPQAG
jgi:N utilization substance protein B